MGIDYRGKINVSASESLSKFEFITKVARLCNYDKHLIIQDSVTNAVHLVSRPKNMSLSNRKLEELGMHIPTIDQMISMQLESN
jgi:dTDP-4-dehydrorhamnose reductase